MIVPDFKIQEYGLAGMIEPFSQKLSQKGIVSFGLSSYGYDVRLGCEFVLLNLSSSVNVLDPLALKPEYGEKVVVQENGYFDIPAHGFVLGHTMEYIRMPPNWTALVKDKSTYARCGLSLQNTVIEAGWEGQITLELHNMLNKPLRVHVGQGIAQLLFFESDPCLMTYADRAGKYQGQTGVTMARIAANAISSSEESSKKAIAQHREPQDVDS